MIDPMVIERIRHGWRLMYPADKHGGIICPIPGCHSGAGKNGTGISEVKGEPGLLHCFGCGFTGDVIQLYATERGLDRQRDFVEIIKGLCRVSGIEYVELEVPKSKSKARDFSSYYETVRAQLEQTDYHIKRGISNETARALGVGFDPKWRHSKSRKGHYKPVMIIPTSSESFIARDVRALEDMPVADRGRTKQNEGSVHIFNEAALSKYETIFAVEGAFDAMSIYEAGFPNVVALNSITSGEKLYKAVQAATPRPRRIILTLDNEASPNVVKAYKDIKEMLEILSVAVTDGRSLSGAYKDANELLVADRAALVENIKRLQAEAETAPVEPTDILTDLPISLSLPPGWELTPEGVFTEKGTAASLTPIVPTRIITQHASQSMKYELSARIDGAWRPMIVDAEVSADPSKATLALSQRGVLTYVGAAKHLVRFLNETIALNRAELPRAVEYTQPGWANDFEDFVLPHFMDYHAPTLEETYTVKGDLEAWLELAREIDENACPIPRLMLDVSFSTPLLALLDRRSYVAYIWGNSLVGKSACQTFAISAWGNPRAMMSTFNATSNGIEAAVTSSNNLPLMIDEKQVARKDFDRRQVIYSIVGETPRERMDKSLTRRVKRNWNLAVMASGESKLLDDGFEAGAINRTLELHIDFDEALFESPTMAGRLHSFVKRHHGVAGREFIKQMMSDRAGNFEIIRRLYGEFERELSREWSAYSTEHVSMVAVIFTAGVMWRHWLMGLPIEEGRARVKAQAGYIFGKLPTAEAITDSGRAWSRVLEWVNEDINHFLGDHLKDRNVLSPIFGSIESHAESGETVYDRVNIYPSALKRMLTEEKYSADKCIRDFGDRGLITRDVTGFPRVYIKDAEGKTTRSRMIVIPGENFKRFY